MGEVHANGEAFDVSVHSKQRSAPVFVLQVKVSNFAELGFHRHELQKVLNVNSRRDLTDEKLASCIESWMESHPDADVKGFGVIEEWPCRSADRIRGDDGGS